MPVNRHELAKIAPTAPPNPRPIPQQTPQPNPQPTQNIFETQPRNELPAAPVSVPTVAPVAGDAEAAADGRAFTRADERAVRASVTKGRRRSFARPPARRRRLRLCRKPHRPPRRSPARAQRRAPRRRLERPRCRRSAPAFRARVRRARPRSRQTAGTAPSPGPSGGASPGPRTGAGPKAQAAPARPIAVPPTPPPGPRATAAPKTRTAPNINAKLRSLLPNNPVHPTSKSYAPSYSLRGRMEPTPPPEVLAKTKYIYEVRNTGNEARVKMWVTAARKDGPTTICTGWLVRYPQAIRGGYADAAGPDPSIVHSDLHGGTRQRHADRDRRRRFGEPRAAQPVRRRACADRRRHSVAAVRRPPAGAVRTVARFVAMNSSRFPLEFGH